MLDLMDEGYLYGPTRTVTASLGVTILWPEFTGKYAYIYALRWMYNPSNHPDPLNAAATTSLEAPTLWPELTGEYAYIYILYARHDRRTRRCEMSRQD